MQAEKVPNKAYIQLSCGCWYVLLRVDPRAPSCMQCIVHEDCGSEEHNRRKKGAFRRVKRTADIHYDALAQELIARFGGSFV